MSAGPTAPQTLRRELGLGAATALGLASMVGTGVFVSIGLAAAHAGPAVIVATLIAALLALFNALSSAQLAAAHPVSGGTYEYGHRWLGPGVGFTAGWLFLLAKTSSAATAALGIAGYLGAVAGPRMPLPLIAVAVTLLLAAITAGGVRRSVRGAEWTLVIAIAGLLLLCVASLPFAMSAGSHNFIPFVSESGYRGVLDGAALMFVAFTGYGRIATMGEEVRDPRRTIPRAIMITVFSAALLYTAVAAAAIAVLGWRGLAVSAERSAAPLEEAAAILPVPWLSPLIAVSAVAAMTGVLLSLLLGLSRVLLAMARRREAPGFVATVNARSGTPAAAVWTSAGVIMVLALIGDIRATWSFSALTVLVYYAITNAAALRLSAEERLYPRWLAGAGLLACVSLSFRVPAATWVAAAIALGAGFMLRRLFRTG